MSRRIFFILSFVVSLSVMAQTYVNPILGGDHPDPTLVRDGKDYYMTHSSFEYLPGLTVYHSRDLVNWEPVGSALDKPLGSVWAPDLCKYNGKYYIYFTTSDGHDNFRNYVVTADNPAGPWSGCSVTARQSARRAAWPTPRWTGRSVKAPTGAGAIWRISTGRSPGS